MINKIMKLFLWIAITSAGFAFAIPAVLASTSYSYPSGAVVQVHDNNPAEVTKGNAFIDACENTGGIAIDNSGTDTNGSYTGWSCTISVTFQVPDTTNGTPITGSNSGNLSCASGQFTDYGTSNGQPTCTSKCSGNQVGDYNNGLCMSDCPTADIGSCTSSATNSNSTGSGTTGGTVSPSGTNNPSSGGSSGGSDTGLVCANGTCTYTLLEPLPGRTDNTVNSGTFFSYLNGFIVILIIVGAMLAVVRFSIGGIIYMTSDIAGNRAKAKSQMWACVWGILLLVSSVLILQTVNPDLVKLNFFQDLSCLSNPVATDCIVAHGGT